MVLHRSACPAGVDDSIGPWAGEDCRGGFDFTLLFEESILTIPLQCIFLLILPARAVHLAKSDCKVIPSAQRQFKACASACLVALNAALVVLWTSGASSPLPHTRATVAVAVLVCCASLGISVLSWLEHERTIRPSFILSVYLFLSILLDIARARTLWLFGARHAIMVVFTCTIAIRAVMLVLESCEKRKILVSRHKGQSKEATSSPMSRTVFFWLTSLFWNGYKKILTLQDLYPLDMDLKSMNVHKALAEAWGKVPNKTTPGVFLITWLRVFAGPVLFPVIPRLFLTGFQYAQPFLINSAVKLAAMPQMQQFSNVGYGLIGAYVIVYTGIAVSTGQYDWRVSRAATMMRGSVISLVYQKALCLDLTSPNVSPSGALTLIGTDTETVLGLMQLHELWAGMLDTGIGIYLIYRELGAACAMPVALAVATLIGTAFFAVPLGNASAAWIKASQDRVTATSKTLGGIKWLKMSGLNDMAFSVILKLRKHELDVSKRLRILLGVTVMISICTPVWTPVLTFATYAGAEAGGDNTLTIAKAFTSIALFALVNKPLTDIIMALPTLSAAVTSFQRIQDFLNGKERDDNRQTGRLEMGINERKKTGDPLAARTLAISGAEDTHELVIMRSANGSVLGRDFIASVQGKFSWAEDSEPVIDIGDWGIRRRALTMVIGPVGCGKSTLLKALLGELSSFQGTIRTNYSGVTYCGQNSWVPNHTVRNVIVGQDEFDESWYRSVINACALEPDIRNWPKGDQTAVGTMGISISGGQKRRLSLARALYSRREFFIFDDIFSGLDSATEDLVFDNLFGEHGLLRGGDTTVVIASSDLRRIPYADELLILTNKGRVSNAGTPEALGELLAYPLAETKRRNGRMAPATRPSDPNTQRIETVVATMEVQADSTRQLGDPKIYKFYAQAAGRITLATFFVSMIIFAFCESFPSIWLKWWAEASELNPNTDLSKWLGVYAALAAGSILAILLGIWQLFIVVIDNSGVYFHGLLLETTSRAPLSFHATVDTGVTVNRFSQDLQLIDMELPGAALGVAIAAAFIVAQIALVAASSKYMAIFLPFVMLAFYTVGHFYLRTSRQMRLLDIEHKAPLYTQLIETLEGLVTIRAFQWEKGFEKINMALLDDAQRPSYLLYCLQRWLTFTVDMMVTVLALILIVFTTTLRDQIGPGYMGVALSNILSFGVTLKVLITSWIMLEISLGAVARVKSFASTTEAEDTADEAIVELGDMTWPSHGAVELEDVTASYPSTGIALRDITLSIQPGERVAICGRTGSGKSSLAICLLRMMDLDSGSIKIDGIDVSTLPHKCVRSKLTTVPQEAYIFDGTVRLNVDPTETVPDEDIIKALEKLRLWAKIEQRGGLDAVIHDKFFSSGEAQLLIFARAMVRKGKVLILDEITSSLDDEASDIVLDVLLSWFQGWTIIMIAHKLSAILSFDKVAVLEDGRLAEHGNPGQLLERNSIFKSLYELSTRDSPADP